MDLDKNEGKKTKKGKQRVETKDLLLLGFETQEILL